MLFEQIARNRRHTIWLLIFMAGWLWLSDLVLLAFSNFFNEDQWWPTS